MSDVPDIEFKVTLSSEDLSRIGFDRLGLLMDPVALKHLKFSRAHSLLADAGVELIFETIID